MEAFVVTGERGTGSGKRGTGNMEWRTVREVGGGVGSVRIEGEYGKLR